MMAMKRDFDHGVQDSHENKRFRPEEVIGVMNGDHVTTRLLMNKLEFSKLIGRGGSTISSIRTATGLNIRGTNVEDELRLVIFAGPFQSVQRAFDMITEIINGGVVDNYMMSMNMLLEHSRAGKIVGSKGATIQNVQNKSGCTNVRIEKDPREYSGVPLRKIVLEGPISAVRRAHYMVHEIYMQDSNIGGYGQNSFGMGGGGMGGGRGMMGRNQAVDPDGGVPFSTLVNYGVQSETVRQLLEMKAYLLRHFGLNLTVFKEGQSFNPPSLITTPSSHTQERERLTLEQAIAKRKTLSSESQELCFGIPKQYAGSIIGKAGSVLRDLQIEFHVKIHVEKEEYDGIYRLVVLQSITGDGAFSEDSEKVAALMHCHARISKIISDQEAASNQIQSSEDDIGTSIQAPEHIAESTSDVTQGN